MDFASYTAEWGVEFPCIAKEDGEELQTVAGNGNIAGFKYLLYPDKTWKFMPKDADLIASGLKEHNHTGVLTKKMEQSNHLAISSLYKSTVSFANELSGEFTISLFTLSGKQIHSQRVSLRGSNTVALTSTPLSSGVYLVSVESPIASFHSKQIVQ